MFPPAAFGREAPPVEELPVQELPEKTVAARPAEQNFGVALDGGDGPD